MMKFLHKRAVLAALAGLSSVSLAHAQPGRYVETDLVVNKQAVDGVPTLVDSNGITHIAKFFDPHLVNPWGVGESSTSPFWVSDNGSGLSTLYNTAGTPQSLVVSIPSPGNPLAATGTPTGLVFNTASAQGAFPISGFNAAGAAVTAPAVFLFATEDGTILGWNPGVNPMGFNPAKAGTYAIIAVTTPNAVYKGLAIATDSFGTTRLYATNFHAGTVDVFNTSFQPAPPPPFGFIDENLPRGYAPFNIVPITFKGVTQLYVTYAVQDAAKHDDVPGQGHGIVDIFKLDGGWGDRFSQHGQLNSPWGVTLAPDGFGELGGNVWIGNFGNGQINAYDPGSGQFINKVRDGHGQAIVIDGLWTLMFGNGGNGGAAGTLYFTAGPNGEKDGLFGAINPQ
jgi:uncharacterized protein (TIGR03118 family)